MTQTLSDWLHDEECLRVLDRCARSVIKKAQRNEINLKRLFHEDDGADNDNNPDFHGVVKGRLWEHLKEHAERIQRKAYPYLDGDRLSGFIEIVAEDFLMKCLDKRRSFSGETLKAYYRHLREVLSKSEEVRYEAEKQGAFYAYSSSPDLQRLPMAEWNQTYSGWPRPSTPFTEIHTARGIMAISRVFWDESVIRFQKEYLLPIKALLHYTCSCYNLSTEIENDIPDPFESDEGGDSGLDGRKLGSDIADMDELGCQALQEPRLDMLIIERELRDLAKDCAAEISDKGKRILVMRNDEKTLEEIALDLDEKGPSNIHYHQKKAYESIARKWITWGPSSPVQFSEDDEEDFFSFYDMIIEICKNDLERREIRQESK